MSEIIKITDDREKKMKKQTNKQAKTETNKGGQKLQWKGES